VNPVKLFKLFGLYERFEAIEKEKAPMKVKLPQLLTLFTTLSATIGLPSLVTSWVHAHAAVYMGIVAAAIVLHAIMPSVFAAPGDADTKATGLNKLGVFLLLALLPVGMRAQQQLEPSALQNVYAAGGSYSVGGSPAIAGTGLYAHLVTDRGTYAFSAVDAVPNTMKPFTVTTNIGVGVAQKIVTLGKVPIFVPTAAGISWSGSNTGWQWNAGALASIHLKGEYYLMPTVRVLKSSVSNGTGYQPIVGVLFAWGK
jgi:hypothetical protein